MSGAARVSFEVGGCDAHLAACSVVLTPDEVAAWLRVSRATVLAWVRSGRLARIGGLRVVRIPRWSVDEVIYSGAGARPQRGLDLPAPGRRGTGDRPGEAWRLPRAVGES